MFTIQWRPLAQNELADLWVEADSAKRQAITHACNLIDHRLRFDPSQEGESRTKGRRILFVDPLGIIFQVFPQRSKVAILHVWTWARRAN